MTVWIGLTGGIGSGKTQAAAEFSKLGVPVIDADAVSRRLTADGGAALPHIRRQFGAAYFDKTGRLNRDAMRREVFRRPDAKRMLENIMHPLIIEEIRSEMKHLSNVPYGIVDIPLLVEIPAFRALADRIIVVDTDEETQISRVRQRSGLPEQEIRAVMAAQAGRKERLRMADDVLQNMGSQAELAEKIRNLNRFYRAVYGDGLK